MLVVLLAAAAVWIGGCGAGSGGTDPTGRALRGTFGSFPDSLDPALSFSSEGASALQNTYVPLLTYAHASGSAGTRVIPGLARSLPRLSDGGRIYTLQLRPGLRYSDGSPVRASDFTHALERVFELNSPASPFYTDIVGAEHFARTKRGGIAGIETDDHSGEIVIHLVEPRSTFVDELALHFAAPVPADTPTRDMSAAPPPATGPYAITDVRLGRSWDYERNPWWASANGKEMPDLPAGHIRRIEISVLHNASTQVNDIEADSSDWMENPPPPDRLAEVWKKYLGTQFREEPTISTFYFWMNTTKPPFDDVRVRRAVNYAIDPAALERIYAGQVRPTQQILPPGMPGYRRYELYPHDMAKARRLIAAADPSDRQITVWTCDAPPNREVGEYYQDVLSRLGFDVKLQVLDVANYFTVIGNRSTPDLDTGLANWIEDYPNPYDFFGPQLSGESISATGNTNWAQIDVPELNEEIRRLGREPLGRKQESRYAELDRSFMRRAPWAPYGTLKLSTFVSSDIDLDKVVFSPIFGDDLTSFRFKGP